MEEQQFVLRLDKESIKRKMKVFELVKIQEGNMGTLVRVLSRCLVSKETNQNVPEDDALKYLSNISVAELEELAQVLLQLVGSASVPL